MEDLNKWLNTDLGTSNENYCNSVENIRKWHSKFSTLSDKDNITLNVSMYFFPLILMKKIQKNSGF